MNESQENFVNYGRATVPFSQKELAWRLPCGKFTRDRSKAPNMAKRMNRIMSGQAKCEVGV